VNKINRFARENSLLVIVDIQEKLARTMSERDRVLRNCGKLIKTAQALNIPILITEQYPNGLGRTLPELESLLVNAEPIEKVTFSCYLESSFIDALAIENKSHIIVAGMETHICVVQTALDLLQHGYTVGVVQDAVCSFNLRDTEIAITRMRDENVVMLSTEMIIYELLKRSGTSEFKKLLPILKEREESG